MSLADLIKSRSSSASLEQPSAAPGAAFPPVEPVPSEGSSSEELESSEGGGNQEWRRPDSVLRQRLRLLGRRLASNTELRAREHSHLSSAQAATTPDPESKEEKPYGVAEVTTPSGIAVYYQAGPKRLYRLRRLEDGGPNVTKWFEATSVTTILDILEKGGLPWWGMKIGVAGVLELLDGGVLWARDGERALFVTKDDVVHPASVDLIVGNRDLGIKGLLTEHKLTVNHVRDEAGGRGQNVHDALESWAEKGIAPQPAVYAPEEQGYVQGLVDFLIDSAVEAVMSEVMVGSVKHRFAGRFDLVAKIPNGVEVVVRTFPKAKPIRAKLPGGRYLLDLKTSKDVYDTHFLQLEAYEEALTECGYEPTLYRGVIHVTGDGRYELQLNLTRTSEEGKARKHLPDFEKGKPLVTFTDFKHVMAAQKALARIKGRK